MSENATPEPPKKNRLIGIDFARGLALLGMVLVNYKLKMGADERGYKWFVWLNYRLEGRAAALFVVLAGVGISLRASRALKDPENHAAYERGALLKRAALLFVVGMLNLHMWSWDILHCYGVYLALAALFLTARSRTLWIVALAVIAAPVLLHFQFDYHQKIPFWTLTGMSWSILFNGTHPALPWFAFLLIGMWLGRQDLHDEGLCRRIFWVALGLMLLGEFAGFSGDYQWFGISKNTGLWWSSWPRPPLPMYMLASASFAVATIVLCISLLRQRSQLKWVIAVGATGQMAFTLYIAHIVAILIPQQHGWFKNSSLWVSTLYSFCFFFAAVAGSLWWRRRFAQGPIEGFVRQITGRNTPAPWGVEPLAK